MDDIKKAYAWQEAIDLSKQLVTVCEEFSDADTNVLVWHLRQAVVDIPSEIAANLQTGKKADLEAMVKLATVLELVQRVYPAIETGDVEARFEKLWQRLSSGAFAEREPQPEGEDAEEVPEIATAAPISDPEETEEAEASEPDEPAPKKTIEVSVPVKGKE